MEKCKLAATFTAVCFLVVFFTVRSNSAPTDKLTPHDFGLVLKEGQIDYSRMSPAQKDTIAIGLFNTEDYLLDIAVYHGSRTEIVIYRNLGNGFLSTCNTFPQQKEVRRIEAVMPASPEAPSQRSDLKVTYRDGTQRRISNREINGLTTNAVTRVPLWDPLNDPRAFVYDITFVEQWRSWRNGQPQYWTALGDIDRDGKNEAVYTFWPLNDTNWPSTIVVFENVSQNQYRIDWDTTLYYVGGFNIFSNVTDFDHDGNKEFFVRALNQFNYYNIMICECTGEGRYRFRNSPIGGYASQPMEIQVKDSAAVVNGEPKAEVWILETFDWSYSLSYISRCRFNVKSGGAYSFYLMGAPQVNNFAYSLSVGDIDRDGRKEYILGTAVWSSYYFVYLDSTGVSTNLGYEKKIVYLNEPLSVGYSFTKDFDGDGYEEGVLCGGAYGIGGTIGIIKHSGSPGQSQFNVVWWDSGLYAAPNMGIDTGYIDNQYCILYPMYKYAGGNHDILIINLFTRNGTYSFYKTCLQEIDSVASVHARLFDIDKDGKMNIIAPAGNTGTRFWLADFEQVGVIGIEPINKEVPQDYKLWQNYPNPFNPKTTIKFNVPVGNAYMRSVQLVVFDILGREVKKLFSQKTKAGSYKIDFDGSGFSSGVYFYTLFADGKLIDTKKMILLK